jgi:hypothetical protein
MSFPCVWHVSFMPLPSVLMRPGAAFSASSGAVAISFVSSVGVHASVPLCGVAGWEDMRRWLVFPPAAVARSLPGPEMALLSGTEELIFLPYEPRLEDHEI